MSKLRDIRWDREYKNRAESLFAKTAREHGWMVTKRGWPDFICYRNNDIMLVEVKRKGAYRLKRTQEKFMKTISGYGVKCYRWSPDRDWLQNDIVPQ